MKRNRYSNNRFIYRYSNIYLIVIKHIEIYSKSRYSNRYEIRQFITTDIVIKDMMMIREIATGINNKYTNRYSNYRSHNNRYDNRYSNYRQTVVIIEVVQL